MEAAVAEVAPSAQTELCFLREELFVVKAAGAVWTDVVFSGENNFLGYINGFSRFCTVA